jgi:hypothetical protein
MEGPDAHAPEAPAIDVAHPHLNVIDVFAEMFTHLALDVKVRRQTDCSSPPANNLVTRSISDGARAQARKPIQRLEPSSNALRARIAERSDSPTHGSPNLLLFLAADFVSR